MVIAEADEESGRLMVGPWAWPAALVVASSPGRVDRREAEVVRLLGAGDAPVGLAAREVEVGKAIEPFGLLWVRSMAEQRLVRRAYAGATSGSVSTARYVMSPPRCADARVNAATAV